MASSIEKRIERLERAVNSLLAAQEIRGDVTKYSGGRYQIEHKRVPEPAYNMGSAHIRIDPDVYEAISERAVQKGRSRREVASILLRVSLSLEGEEQREH